MASTPTATDIGASGDDDPALAALRTDVRLLARRIEGEPLIYLDSAASSLTPGRVLRAMMDYYENHRANVHRGKHLLSEEASEAFEDARRKVARFVNADPATVVFTAGATASINLVVLGLQLTQADVVVTTSAEHHAVLLPLMGRATLRMLDVGVDGRVDPDALLALVDERTRLVALAHASNVTGAVHDVAGIITRLR
ncbi:MAG: aminotransferase class V-fold PLP-dependent enzyme, partial [Deltaproteobacteria bacterium]|nr:aminotransferase class V-fold PLP-dependent enzyme [Deltaproteobacteria bacterium]